MFTATATDLGLFPGDHNNCRTYTYWTRYRIVATAYRFRYDIGTSAVAVAAAAMAAWMSQGARQFVDANTAQLSKSVAFLKQ